MPPERSLLVTLSRRFPAILRRCAPVSLAFAAALALPVEPAQDPPPTQEEPPIYGPPAPPPEPEQITIEQVQARFDELNAIAEPDQPTRDAKDLLTPALSTLRLAAQEREKAAEFDRQRQAAPATLEQVQAELDSPPRPARPAPPEDATLEQLRQFLNEATAAEQSAREQLDGLREEQNSRRRRREAIPGARENLRVELENITDEIAAPPAADESPVLTEARRLSMQAVRQRIQAQLAALDAEIANYDARSELLPKRIQRWETRLNVRTQEATAWREYVARAEQQHALTEVEQAREELDSPYAVIRDIAQQNLDLTQRRTAPDGPLNRKDEIQRERNQHDWQELDSLEDQFQLARQRAAALTGSQTYDVILRRLRDDLPDLNELNQRLRELDNEYAAVQVEQSDLEYERERLGTQPEQVERAVSAIEEISDPDEIAQIRSDIERLVSEQRSKYDTLIDDYRTLAADLVTLQEHYRQEIDIVGNFRQFIDERILWIRSADPINLDDFQSAGERIYALINPSSWLSVARDILTGTLRMPLIGVLIVLILGAGLLLRRRLVGIIRRAADQIERPFTDRMRWTWQALAATLAMAIIWPALMWLVAAAIHSAPQSGDFSLAVAAGLSRAALILLFYEVLRQLCRPRGLGDVHFEWPRQSRILLKRTIGWLIPATVPVAFLIAALEWLTGNSGSDPLSRFAFIAGMIILAIAAWRILHPTSGITKHYLESHKGGWLDRLRYAWFGGVVAIPLALGVFAGFGYYHTALQIEHRVLATVWMIVVVIVLSGLARRWLLQARRRIAMEEARKRHAAAMAKLAEAAKKEDADAKPGEGLPPIEEPTVNINELDAQARQLLSTVMIIALIIGLWLAWAQMLPALRSLDRIELWPNPGIRELTTTHYERAQIEPPTQSQASRQQQSQRQPQSQPNNQSASPQNGQTNNQSTANPNAAAQDPASTTLTGITTSTGAGADDSAGAAIDAPIADALTLGDLIVAVVIVIVTVLLSRNLPGLLEMTLLQRLPLEPSGRYAVTTLARYVLIIIGTIMAFGAIGIGWSKVQWLAAAITVGLGFGLQEIFANFVSGIIILFERPVRVGDTVTIGEVSGTVTRIRMRATTICDWDRKELIIPNKEFVTGQIINWSLTDPILRITIPVGIAYGSDTELAKKLLLEVAAKEENVLNDPPPRALFIGFGDSALNFDLRVFIPSIDYFLTTRDDLHYAIDRAFREHHIEIAFPQRDIHVRSIRAELPVDVKPQVPAPE